MMRATSKRHSHTSISESSEIRPMSVSSFHKQSSPSAWTRQPMQSMFGASSMPHLEAHMSQFSPTLGGSSDLHYQPATPYWTSFSHESTGVSQPQSTFEQNAQRALQQEWQPIDNNLEMSRSWRMSSHLGGMSSPVSGKVIITNDEMPAIDSSSIAVLWLVDRLGACWIVRQHEHE